MVEHVTVNQLNLFSIFFTTRNILKFILISIFSFFIFIFIFFSVNEINKAPKILKVNLLIKDETIKSILSNSLIINDESLNFALSKSGIDLSYKKIVMDNLTLVSGHHKINELISYISKQDLEEFSTRIAIDPNYVETYLKNIIDQGLGYKTLYFNYTDIDLSEDKKNLLISNLINFVNIQIKKDVDLKGINVKKLDYKEINELDEKIILEIIDYINLLEGYTNYLIRNYQNASRENNLDQINLRIKNIDRLIYEILRYKPDYSTIIQRINRLEKERLDLRIKSVLDIISLIDNSTKFSNELNSEIVNQSPENSSSAPSFTFDSLFLNEILLMSKENSVIELKKRYLDLLNDLNQQRINIIIKIKFIETNSDFITSLDETDIISNQKNIDTLNSEFINITETLNQYINSVETIDNFDPIMMISNDYQSINRGLKYYLSIISMILVSSIIFSFLVTLLLNIISILKRAK